MSSIPEDCHRTRVGELPLLQAAARQLGFDRLLRHYVKESHGNEKYPVADSLLLLVFNIASGRNPLYELGRWTTELDGRLLGYRSGFSSELFNDDRYGRALDKFFEVDRASLMTEVVLRMVRATGCRLDQLHNDSTTVSARGRMPSVSGTGLFFARGFSKEHRHDLKQIVFNLTISADGAVPVHFKSYPGNRTDDTLHIETWKELCGIAGRKDFLYVADCKLCTHEQLSFITGNGGRVVTIMPETWKDVRLFKESMRENPKRKIRILRRPKPNRKGSFETFYRIEGEYKTVDGNYNVYWIYSPDKAKQDRETRRKRLEEADLALEDIASKLNTYNLKTEEQIVQRLEKVLKENKVAGFYDIEIASETKTCKRQKGRGRPGKNTQYVKHTTTLYSLSWKRNKEALKKERNVDGLFPLMCTDESMGARKALAAYKYQPRLEKRFQQFKSEHLAAPVLFKKIERVEAMMFLFFMALILQSVIERKVRLSMEARNIEGIPIYPEGRMASRPTTARILEQFHNISVSRVMQGDELVREDKDKLTDVQKQILDLLGMTEKGYWDSLIPRKQN